MALTNGRTHGTTILFKEKEYSGTPDGPLCPFAVSPPTAASLTQVISDLGPVSVDRFFSSHPHKWKLQSMYFSPHSAWCIWESSIPLPCTSGISTNFSWGVLFLWMNMSQSYISIHLMMDIWNVFNSGLLWTKLLQTSPFCGLMLYKFHLHFLNSLMNLLLNGC